MVKHVDIKELTGLHDLARHQHILGAECESYGSSKLVRLFLDL
jgi:hypothetical protein